MKSVAVVLGTRPEASRLLSDPTAYEAMTRGHNPYGDGLASARIARALGRWARGEEQLLASDEQFGHKEEQGS